MTDNHAVDNQAITEAQVTVQEATDAVDDEGTRLENFISPRTFVSLPEILPMLAGLPIGQSVPLGHIAGYVRSYERRDSQLPLKAGDKPPPPSIWLRGMFEATNYQTGEITRATWAILPRVMGELVSEALDNNEGEAVLDLELGVAATGRAIPYTYTVTNYSANRAQAALSAIRMRHMKRLAAKRSTVLIREIENGKTLAEASDVADEQAEIRRLPAVKRKAK